ncbi:MAG TPA: acyl-CoA thioesterase [Phycisphaerae bacterium]|jgi:acyl-CoA thioesterase YciA
MEQLPKIKPPTSEPAIRVVMMPRDTNAEGTIFGGVLLSYIDQASYVEAKRQARHKYVTVAMNGVEFKQPVFVGDLVSFYAHTTRIGRSSIHIKVEVFADRLRQEGVRVKVTEADVVFVAVDDACRPVTIRPGT